MKSEYSLPDNVRNWIFMAAFIAVFGWTLPIDTNPEIAFYYGLIIGGMFIWAMWIGHEWLKPYVKETEEES